MEKAIDVVIAVALFSSSLIASSLLLFNHFSAQKSNLQDVELSYRAEKLALALLSPEWLGFEDIENRSYLGVQDVKLRNLMSQSYDSVREKLGENFMLRIAYNYQWANSSYAYRIPIYIQNSSRNATALITVRRAHCSSFVLYDARGKKCIFNVEVLGYYDPDHRYARLIRVNFSTTGENLYYLYCSPRNYSQSYSSIAGSLQEAISGKEEKYIEVEFGRLSLKLPVSFHVIYGGYISSPRVAYLGSLDEVTPISEMGYSVDSFSTTDVLFNFSSNTSLYTYDALVIGSHATQNSILYANLTSHASDLFNYVALGGNLIVLGQDGRYSFLLPFYIRGFSGYGKNQSLPFSYISLLNFPYNLTSGYLNSTEGTHPSFPDNTFWSWLKPLNRTAYSELLILAENISTVQESYIVNGDFSSSPEPEWVNTSSPGVVNNWSTSGTLAYSAQSYTNTPSTDGYGNWSQSFYYNGSALPEKALLNFSWRVYNYTNALPSELFVYLKTPSGESYLLWTVTYNTTSPWRDESLDISPLLNQNGTYTITLSAHLITSSTPTAGNHIAWDNVSIYVEYKPVVTLWGELGYGKIAVTGDEPYYSGHKNLLKNLLYHMLKSDFVVYPVRIEVGVE